eukprot:SAG31_NODE_19281_length_607_cov_1.009843_1_plen_89_part_01
MDGEPGDSAAVACSRLWWPVREVLCCWGHGGMSAAAVAPTPITPARVSAASPAATPVDDPAPTSPEAPKAVADALPALRVNLPAALQDQ